MELKEKPRAKREKAKNITETYEAAFPKVARFVKKMGGSLDDAKDIFHDAIIVYYELRTKKANKIHTSEVAYILGIAKHMWIRKYNRQRNHISLSLIENQISIPEDYYLGVQDKKLFSLLNLTGKKCMELLRTFYFKKTSLEELITVLGYPNKHAASVQKYKCLEKVRNFVKEKTLSYDDFKK
ncbi:sigma-70 family RNA polymerase sigma factor [Galbibacter sp. EGI 63066]|uniref:RNA polymerase sigma factor n=1 Tax=Galbibacter sp. EGI 63066 TaxID=2993559 RepID=UPI0022495587|nr:sigma-70 family RNA polymerase sigma factor [Galbibacter sp. EGI 63066]MCX2679003.1 sigma-70 family RNA polymerase sigma factor [Galbibacter sp. EGI 63066]